MMLPPYESKSVEIGFVTNSFDSPITKAELGIPFSFLERQRTETQLTANRFGRIQEITCEASHWVSFLKTRGTPEEQISDFKETVGYQEPEPTPEPVATAPAKE
jgi:hypothetical protein